MNARRLRFERLELRCLLSANPGDFDANGLVAATDFILYRKADPRADSNGDTHIDQTDYNAWRNNFGNAQLPGAFSITGPDHILIDDHNLTVTWTPSLGATSYRISVSQQADGSNPYFTEVDLSNSKTFNGSWGDRTAYFSIDAINAAGEVPALNQNYFVKTLIPAKPQVLFVSSQDYYIDPFGSYPPSFGEFGSAQSADFQVNDLANVAGLFAQPWDGSSIQFKAIVTITYDDVDTRAGLRNDPFINTRGEIIALNHADLFDGTLGAPILDENRNPVPDNQPVWTGANPDGTWSGETAYDWSNINSTATIGSTNRTGMEWLSFGTRASFFSAHLYGVGDEQVPYGSFAPIQRSGSADPATQGFASTTSGAPSTVAALQNDSGHAAWSIAGTAQNSQLTYNKNLSADNNTALRLQGFNLQFDARALPGLAPAYDNINHVAVAAAFVDVDNRRFEVDLGVDANGDTVVILPSSIDNAGPGGSVRAAGDSFTLIGSGAAWHNYQFVYNPTTQQAQLLVDGVPRFDHYTGYANGGSSKFGFGAMSGG